MNNTTATKPFIIYIGKVKNLHISEAELANFNLYIDHVENLHMGKTEPPTAANSPYEKTPDHRAPFPSPTLTNSQRVLACYYILLSWGVQIRSKVDIADVARFMHALTDKTYKSVDSSDFYKKLLQVPQLKSNLGLIKDLEVVHNLFLHLELKQASLLVEKEIIKIRQEINIPHK